MGIALVKQRGRKLLDRQKSTWEDLAGEDLYAFLESQIDRLPQTEKVKLTEKLLNKQQGLHIVLGGNNQIGGSIVVQINSMDKEALAQIINAVAVRISGEVS